MNEALRAVSRDGTGASPIRPRWTATASLVAAGVALMSPAFLGTGSDGWLWDTLNGFGFAAGAVLLVLAAGPGQRPPATAVPTHRFLAHLAGGFVLVHAFGLLILEPALLLHMTSAPSAALWAGCAGALLLVATSILAPPARRAEARRERQPRRWLTRGHRIAALLLAAAVAWHVVGTGFYLGSTTRQAAFLSVAVALPLLALIARRRGSTSSRGLRTPRACRAALVAVGVVLAVALAADRGT